MFVKTMSYALAFDTVIFITFLLLCSFQRTIEGIPSKLTNAEPNAST